VNKTRQVRGSKGIDGGVGWEERGKKGRGRSENV